MVVRVALLYGEIGWAGGHPGMPEHELLQDFEGAGPCFLAVSM